MCYEVERDGVLDSASGVIDYVLEPLAESGWSRVYQTFKHPQL